ncbi:VWA domain-containing protein [Polycladomyces sp. WAk]|uniref:VWA domain-containing protein n=1 Tax=Polycladomyces zharkentensis TaxID=2807616 RepID=A0ABS2WEZ0_9BACL|nr:VWA domain-containing protein [Polycladomyces sp. WAk]MBN2908102.1 VWA domain-containing protein [Polycladomyces sp. WAk]
MTTKNMKRRVLSVFIICYLSFFTTACGSSVIGQTDNSHQKNSHPVKKGPFQAVEPTQQNIDKLLAEGPGIYAGNKYDKKKVEQEMLKVKNAPARVQYNKMVELLAEDYTDAKRYYENFDTSIGQMTAPPDAKGGSTETGSSSQANKQKVNVEILLDASGSMNAKIEGKTKMEMAKEAINKFLSSLPKEVNVSLRVYGNKGSNKPADKAVSCQSSDIIYPLQPYDSASFNQAITPVKPMGWTPLARAIQQAQTDLQSETGAKNIVYVVSDGVETCGGDPVAAAQALHASNIQAVVNIIGFDVDDAGQRALKAVAEAGSGKYATVKTAQDFDTYFENEKKVGLLDYLFWANKNYDKSSEIAMKKQTEVVNTSVATFNKVSNEFNRMIDACQVIHPDDILGCSGELGQLINNRYELLKNWNDRMEQKVWWDIQHNWDRFNERVSRQLDEGTKTP